MEKCSVAGCEKPTKTKGWCHGHYHRWRKHGNISPDVPLRIRRSYVEGQLCEIENCANPVHKKGWCQRHYDRWRNHGDPLGGRDGPPMRRYAKGQTCDIQACERIPMALGYCTIHYASLRKYGDPLKARWRTNQQARDHWHLDRQGYVWRYEPGNKNAGQNGYVFQHRHVMSGIIGRPLLKTENVHHKNGGRADNRPSNLELWISAQPSGQRIQDLVKWAREILEQYGDLVDRML